ncbi:hypothetical protein GO986_06400 [Deinococcus sp. HMF7620]|uniref:Leucine-binding protein domain-containing protein n=1 Tax=Deinococcus arboris TaxID=2682977 RepID=A0A7C9HQX5_9DEIO|nr:hypothetical protein [Deinococcus arboris]MVN86393.1 hypothetical protein [Deinococcus arboris]
MTPPSRRSVLKAAALVPALFGSGQARAVAVRPLHLAALVPEHDSVPGFTAAFLAGLRSSLDTTRIVLQVAASGPRPSQLRRAAQEVLQGTPDLLLTLGDGLPDLLSDVLPLAGLPTVAAGAGVAPTRMAGRPGLLTATLHAWEAEWLLGQTLAQRRLPTFLLMSQQDSGYDLPLAFSRGLLAAGGTLSGSGLIETAADQRDLIHRAQSSGAQHLHIQDTAQRHASALLRAVRVAGLTVSTTALSATPAPAERISTVTDTGSALWGGFQRAVGPHASHPAAALGHDIGLWVTHSAAQLPQPSPVALIAALSAQQFAGLRGALSVTADGHLSAPLALHTSGRAAQPMTNRPHAAALASGELRSGHLFAFPHAFPG